MSEPLLAVHDISIDFAMQSGVVKAVDHISFTISAGEVLGMVGESGAGKSVTAAAIIGLLDPPGRIAGGMICLRGERIDRLPEHTMRHVRGKHIGMIFQDPLSSLNPFYRIGDQLVEAIRAHTDLSKSTAREKAV